MASVQRNLLPFSVQGRYGYLDQNGTVRIQPKFVYARPFSEERAVVRIDDACIGIIDTTGDILATFKNSIVDATFSESVLAISVNSKYGFVDRKGVFTVRPAFSDVGSFYNGIATASEDGLTWGTINPDGSWRFPPIFRAIVRGSENTNHSGVRLNSEGNCWGLINENGDLISDERYLSIGVASNGLFCVRFTYDEYGVIDSEGQTIFRLPLDGIDSRVSAMSIAASVDNRWGVLNLSGEWIRPPVWTSLGCLADKRRVVFIGGSRDKNNYLIDGKFGYVDDQCQIVIPPQFDQALDFVGGIANVYHSTPDRDFLTYLRTDGSILWSEDPN